jgi:hypothetical protein
MPYSRHYSKICGTSKYFAPQATECGANNLNERMARVISSKQQLAIQRRARIDRGEDSACRQSSTRQVITSAQTQALSTSAQRGCRDQLRQQRCRVCNRIHWMRRSSLGSPVERAPNSSMTAGCINKCRSDHTTQICSPRK